jgi:hypothetical protein
MSTYYKGVNREIYNALLKELYARKPALDLTVPQNYIVVHQPADMRYNLSGRRVVFAICGCRARKKDVKPSH